jgi:hypothetical protein
MKYQPVINTLTTRQSCKIVNIKNPIEDEFAEFGELTIKKEKSKSICGRTNKAEIFTNKSPSSIRHEPKRSHDFSADKNYEEVAKPNLKKPL